MPRSLGALRSGWQPLTEQVTLKRPSGSSRAMVLLLQDGWLTARRGRLKEGKSA